MSVHRVFRHPIRSDFVDKLFFLIDGEVDRICASRTKGPCIEDLRNLYWTSWDGVKFTMGTSSQWPWFGEYMIFHLVRRRIEGLSVAGAVGKLSQERKGFGATNDIWPFVFKVEGAPCLVLAHNMQVGLRSRRPDITILDTQERPLIVIEVKVGFSNPTVLPQALKLLADVATNDTSGLYLVDLGWNGLTVGERYNTQLMRNVCQEIKRKEKDVRVITSPRRSQSAGNMKAPGFCHDAIQFWKLEDLLDDIESLVSRRARHPEWNQEDTGHRRDRE